MLTFLSKRFISSNKFASRMSPAVQFLTRTYNIELSNISPSGPYGIMLKGDLLRHIKEKNLTPVGPFSQAIKKKHDKEVAKPARTQEKVSIFNVISN
jgi:hypothetical protein